MYFAGKWITLWHFQKVDLKENKTCLERRGTGCQGLCWNLHLLTASTPATPSIHPPTATFLSTFYLFAHLLPCIYTRVLFYIWGPRHVSWPAYEIYHAEFVYFLKIVLLEDLGFVHVCSPPPEACSLETLGQFMPGSFIKVLMQTLLGQVLCQRALTERHRILSLVKWTFGWAGVNILTQQSSCPNTPLNSLLSHFNWRWRGIYIDHEMCC